MKKVFKVEAIHDGSIFYAVYQKKLFGWKYISKSVYESEAIRIAESLANPPTYIETKK